MQNKISLNNKCVPIVSSGFLALYPKTSPRYQPQYDQGSFLQNCGVATPLVFLKANPNPYCVINGV